MDINDRVCEVLKHSGQSPTEFAEYIGVSAPSISHIIKKRNKATLDVVAKIKLKFPDLNWEWLILGNGEMMMPKQEKSEKMSSTTPPDLFSVVNDENFGMQDENDRELPIVAPSITETKINDSQPLEKIDANKGIRRIVFFYDDGSFESFEK